MILDLCHSKFLKESDEELCCKRSVNKHNTGISNVFNMVKTKMNKRVQIMVSKAKMPMKTEI